MTAELRKLLALPTPRWTLAATVAAVAIAAIVAAIVGPGKGQDLLPVQLGIGVGTSVAAIVLGAWMVGLEYGQKTIRRALSAEPDRPRLLLTKLAVVLGAVTAVTVVLSVVSAPLFSAIAAAHGESMPVRESLEYGLAAMFNNLVYATASFALVLVTRSMTGGMTIALALAFVIDSWIPGVGDYTLSAAVLELMSQISGDELGGVGADDPNVARALVVTAAWLAALVGASVARFTRADVD